MKTPQTLLRRWPEYAHFIHLLFWPLYGLAFFSVERLLPDRTYTVMYHPLDDLIPFNELFMIPYVYWYFFMVLAVLYTCFRDREAFLRLSRFYILTFGGSILIFLLFPTCQNFRPVQLPRDNFLTDLITLLYRTDTHTNVCPSLHVVGSIGAAIGLCDTKRFGTPLWKWIHWGSAVLICVSTVFVKQHSVLDIFWGVLYSFAAWLIIYKPCATRRIIPAIGGTLLSR